MPLQITVNKFNHKQLIHIIMGKHSTPTEKIGAHTISELVDNGEYLDLVFDWESDNKNSDGESFKIHVNLDLEDGSVRIYEERFDLNMNLIDFFECRNHITDHEAKLAVRRLRKVALKLERI